MIDRMQLQRYCDLAVNDPLFISKEVDGVWSTHCNSAVQMIADAMGCKDFVAKPLANDMYDIMAKSWRKVDGPTAQLMANAGNLVVAARKEKVHGHVTVIYPSDKMAFSASLDKEVPWSVNVGAVPPHVNAIVGISNAFAVAFGEPDYFVWEQ